MQCYEEEDYELRLVKLLAWMHEQAEDLVEEPFLGYFVLSLQFDPCASAIVMYTRLVIVALKCGCTLIIVWVRHFL